MKFISINILYTLTLYLFSLTAYGDSIHQDIKLIARIKTVNQQVQIIQNGKKAPIIGALNNKKLLKSISHLKAGDEALIEGHIVYEKTPDPELHHKKLTPLFIIDSIRPISLSDFGATNAIVHEQELHIGPEDYLTQRGTLPVSPEVASAITLTASLLLLEELTSKNQVSTLDNNMNTGLIVSAGALATGLFVYEQLKKKTKK